MLLCKGTAVTKGKKRYYLKSLSKSTQSTLDRSIFRTAPKFVKSLWTLLNPRTTCWFFFLMKRKWLSLKENLSVQTLFSPRFLSSTPASDLLLQVYCKNQFVQTIVYSFSQAWTEWNDGNSLKNHFLTKSHIRNHQD